ncbi:MAG: ATP-grasp domain-containing protein, partial [Candidatus Latescibacterota bacterium]
EDKALKLAKDIGYPVMIKATAGGGGRGMRVVRTASELPHAFKTAQCEAAAAFGLGDLYLEKYLEFPRHIEFQVMGDSRGEIVHFGERDCSIQRRHQKLIEESPCITLAEETRRAMGEAAVRGAKSVGYQGAGTIEFLFDRATGEFFFMEMNTRIQVEHPVTEMVTGTDLVKAQILVAAGEPLPYRQDEIRFRGHSIECRVNAEDPDNGFIPSPGTLETFHPPGGPGIRVDSHAHSGYVVPPHYDSLLAKLISWGDTRNEAIVRMRRAASEFVIEGIRTTIPFHLRILEHPRFLAGDTDTRFVEGLDQGEQGKRASQAS